MPVPSNVVLDGLSFPETANHSFIAEVDVTALHCTGAWLASHSEKKMSSEAGGETVSDGANPLLGSCPIPISDYREIVLAHGSGGKLSQQLIQKLIVPQFRNELLNPLHDGAVFSVNGSRLAFSTDSYVVSPIFFPGGDIGSLAVNGTVNDLAMCGARPLYLSAGFIVEEGTSDEDFWRVVRSMRAAADAAGVELVTGDTKVVDRGKADKIFINTSGIGVMPDGVNIDPARAVPGDKILLSGPIAVHGIAIMSVREGLEFETEISSDTAPLAGLVEAILEPSGRSCLARPDPRRSDQRLERDRPVAQAPGSFLRRPLSRSAKKSRVRARSLVWIPSTSPTKASLSPLSRPAMRVPSWPP